MTIKIMREERTFETIAIVGVWVGSNYMTTVMSFQKVMPKTFPHRRL